MLAIAIVEVRATLAKVEPAIFRSIVRLNLCSKFKFVTGVACYFYIRVGVNVTKHDREYGHGLELGSERYARRLVSSGINERGLNLIGFCKK